MKIYKSNLPEGESFQDKAVLKNNIAYGRYQKKEEGRISSLLKATLYSAACLSIVPLFNKNFRVRLSDYWRGFVDGKISVSRYAKISRDLNKEEKNLFAPIAKRSNSNSTLSINELEDLSNELLKDIYNNRGSPFELVSKDDEVILRYMVLKGDINAFNIHGGFAEVAIVPKEINKFQHKDFLVDTQLISEESIFIKDRVTFPELNKNYNERQKIFYDMLCNFLIEWQTHNFQNIMKNTEPEKTFHLDLSKSKFLESGKDLPIDLANVLNDFKENFSSYEVEENSISFSL